MEHFVITGKMEGRRGRGRLREQMIDSLAAWMDIDKTASAILAAKDRAVWKDMIANALGQGTYEEEEEDRPVPSNLDGFRPVSTSFNGFRHKTVPGFARCSGISSSFSDVRQVPRLSTKAFAWFH